MKCKLSTGIWCKNKNTQRACINYTWNINVKELWIRALVHSFVIYENPNTHTLPASLPLPRNMHTRFSKWQYDGGWDMCYIHHLCRFLMCKGITLRLWFQVILRAATVHIIIIRISLRLAIAPNHPTQTSHRRPLRIRGHKLMLQTPVYRHW